MAGWGYLLSWEAVQLVVSKVDLYQQQPQQAPGWFAGLHWEDVLVGLLLHEYAEPQNKPDSEHHTPAHTSNTCMLVMMYTKTFSFHRQTIFSKIS